ncbi:MAG: metal-dependent transcriptional regulator [Thermoplasmata archaeon]
MTGKSLTKTDAKYLRFIDESAGGATVVTPSMTARYFHISRVSAMEKLKKLAERGYGEYLPRKGFVLNERGSHFARNVARKHRIFECILSEHLGFDKDSVCSEAGKVDFYLSDAVVERMSEVLGHPKVCPCGNPIYFADVGKGRKEKA